MPATSASLLALGARVRGHTGARRRGPSRGPPRLPRERSEVRDEAIELALLHAVNQGGKLTRRVEQNRAVRVP